jgi:hypothetical protein
MSLESALAEEAAAVLALLEGRSISPSRNSQRNRTISPTGSTQSPVRSMLDIDIPTSSARHASIAGQGVGITSLRPYKSMLDVDGPVSNLATSAPRAFTKAPPKINIEKDYSFEVSNENPNSGPIRASQPNPRASGGSGIFGSYESTRKKDPNPPNSKQPKGRSHSVFSGHKRTASPITTNKLNTNSSGLVPGPNTYITNTGQRLDLSSAYRRMSDAALVNSGSTLGELPFRKLEAIRGESIAPDGGIRLTKDHRIDEEDGDSSDVDSNSTDDENEDSRGRGRRRGSDESDRDVFGGDRTQFRQPKSLLAAAEDESMFGL